MTLASLPLDFASVRAARRDGFSAADLVAESCRRAHATAGDGIFTALVPAAEAIAKAEALQARERAGEALPLLGLAFCVKDNLHVAGMETTCNCPAFSIWPAESAPAVSRLEEAGAVLVGKNTMDQFATGLNGTRSPEPLCRNAVDPAYIPGGSSSGSAVAVARGLVSFSLGSDTGGSGRVPAACNGIVGLKPTLGLVSTRGLVLNSRFLDCVPVFAGTCADAYEILDLIRGHDPLDPFSRPDADAIGRGPVPEGPATFAVFRPNEMPFFGDDAARCAYEENLAILAAAGHRFREIAFAPFAEAGRFVFQSAMVAERLVEYGAILAERPEAIHPAVRSAIEAGTAYSARDAFAALYALQDLKRQATAALSGADALVVPTVPTIFTIEAMLAEPIARNAAMGTYTYFANPLDFCAITVPGRSRGDGLPSALCFLGGAGQDHVVARLAGAFTDAARPAT
ncbi:allophanate hydrolase [Methylobacterium radiotolerans]|uniref:Amidase n=1 Tax=Methylobacterium radiotolerans (strain ATCC 27329 / DSM 1819 / JCM 2831 / NBRC 15690 / NCIMB 10815 / 0-1) TaxID=426355 RepID=B1M9B2_METRJ|nr:allophanate hydrolase [Methylobacterium radiotolerans]ACB28087.1 Amidase [Methylobacterium radiotolerans JCM 2831]GEN00998.1 hypothetical protein MRA01_55370 [Methylobacterium radiotolerans]